MDSKKYLINEFKFEVIPQMCWIKKDSCPWRIKVISPDINWKTPTIQYTRKEFLELIKKTLEYGLQSLELELKKESVNAN